MTSAPHKGWLAAAFALFTALVGPVFAVDLTPEQMQMLQQLPPEQRAKVLEAIASGKVPAAQGEAPLTEPPLQTPKPPDAAPTAAEEQVSQGQDQPTLQETPKPQVTTSKLRLFGYDLFRGVPTTFAPASDIPVPADYVVGPGDTIRVQLFGKEGGEYSLVVSREGLLKFPNIGPVSVAGLRYEEMERRLNKLVSEQMIGMKASISMGPLRSIQVFVLGDAERPGAYTVSALSTIMHTLFISGGVKEVGSLREIQLKRSGRIVKRFDLYKLLLEGDTSEDVRLQPGDALFIPPIGSIVGVAGEVRRPAIYELKNEKTAGELARMAGGFLPTAYPRASQIERIDAVGARTIVDVDLSDLDAASLRVRDGDVVRVYSILEKMENVVILSGHVQRPGGYQWRPGMRLLDLIPSVLDMLPKPDLRYILIKREIQPQRYIEAFSARLDRAIAYPESEDNIQLSPRDEVMVFGITEDRSARVDGVIQQLQQQTTYGTPPKIVAVKGHVFFPGTYPLEPGMRISSLIRAAMDLRPQTDERYALLRREAPNGHVQVIPVNLAAVVQGQENGGDLTLQAKDTLIVFSEFGDRTKLVEPLMQDLRRQATSESLSPEVSISGSVRHEGAFPLVPGMKVSELLKAGGAFTEAAYPLTAELTRYKVVESKKVEIDHLPVDLRAIESGDPTADLTLTPFDRLHVKQIEDWRENEVVELVGEVRFPGGYTVKKGETLRQLIQRAGGLTERGYAFGAVFTREELRKKEQAQIDQLRDRLRSDIAMSTLQDIQGDPKKAEAFAAAQELLTQLENTKAVGRLALNLPKILEDEDAEDVVLRNGDRLYIPRQPQEVTVIGEVNYPTSHLWADDLGRNEYVDLSGGTTYKADKDRIYVVRANGEVLANGGFWASRRHLEPGDTVVVPLDPDRIKPLVLWQSVSQIVYQIAVSAAAVKAVGVF